MIITIEIPDELAPSVVKILKMQGRDDDGLSDVMIMHDMEEFFDADEIVSAYVEATRIADSFVEQIQKNLRNSS